MTKLSRVVTTTAMRTLALASTEIFFIAEHQDQTENRHGQGRQMGLGEISQHFPDILKEKVTASLRNTQQHVKLGEADDDGRGVHETEDYRMRDEIDYAAELDHAQDAAG